LFSSHSHSRSPLACVCKCHCNLYCWYVNFLRSLVHNIMELWFGDLFSRKRIVFTCTKHMVKEIILDYWWTHNVIINLKMPHAHVHETCKNLLFATVPFAPLHLCNSRNLWLSEGKESIFLFFVVWFEWEVHFANLKVLVNENVFNVFSCIYCNYWRI
jgi:hypothetical protein